MTNEQEKIIKEIQMYKFAMMDASLFLDSHPDNKDALDYFNKYNKLNMDKQKEYAEKYGPMTMNDITGNMQSWKWTDNPWPWEGMN